MKNLFSVFSSRRMAFTLFTAFSAGLPLALTGATLQAWMKDLNVDLAVIGIFSLVGLPYSFKFVWAPLMDRFVPPLFGRRRGWILVCQVALTITLLAMGITNPVTTPAFMATLAFFTAFFSASQDIAIDAYRTELVKEEERGAANGLYIMGYRLAMLTSGALALSLAQWLEPVLGDKGAAWRMVYWIMAGCMAVASLSSIMAPEPEGKAKPPRTISEAVVEPFLDYFKRTGALEILLFIFLYKLGDVMAGILTTPFMMELGFQKVDIAAVYKLFGLIATIVGALMGGMLLPKLGLKRALWIFGVLQMVSNLMFMLLAKAGADYSWLVATVAVENFTGGLGTAAFSALLMGLCNQRFTATQYALLSSFFSLPRVAMGYPAAEMIKALGWEQYFLVCTLIALPGILMVFYIYRGGDVLKRVQAVSL